MEEIARKKENKCSKRVILLDVPRGSGAFNKHRICLVFCFSPSHITCFDQGSAEI